MCFGPVPYSMPKLRDIEGATREVKTQDVPCVGSVPFEALSIAPLPTVNIASVFDDAVAQGDMLTSQLKMDVDGLLAKVQGIQDQIQGAIGEVQGAIGEAVGQVEGAINSAIGEATALGDKLKGEIMSQAKAAFGSISDMFPSDRSSDCVALGAPDLKKMDANAFGGALGSMAPDLPIESDALDLESAQEALAAAAPSLPGVPSPPSLGEGLVVPKVPIPPTIALPEKITPVNFGSQPTPDIGLLSGGDF